MASSLFALIDDIASIMDDVAVLSKIAAKKTTGVIGDDLTLNAEQLTGITAEKELPILWAVFKGALKNKIILVPIALLISYFAPWLITPLLMIGGTYLCYEGMEKIHEKLFHKSHPSAPVEQVSEEEKIKGAIRTDFILSAEIIVIALGAIAHGSLLSRILSLSLIAVIMTVGIYGLVALIVKIDDFGLYLSKKKSKALQKIGFVFLNSAPYIMKFLGFSGTVAMFLVGGSIIAHGIPPIGHAIENLASGENQKLALFLPSLAEALVGVIVGTLTLVIVSKIKSLKKPSHENA